MNTGPQEISINPHAAFDATILGLPAVAGVPFSLAALEHGDRWFSVDLRPDEYNVIDDRTETRTRVSLCVREEGESRPGGWDVDAWGPRAATAVEIQLMARVCLAAHAAYADDEFSAPAELSTVRLA